MDHIDEVLTTQSRDINFEPSIRAALSIAKKMLNKYYDKTDHSEVYRIAMSTSLFNSMPNKLSFEQVLHPRHKLKYFENAGWHADWITAAKDIIRAEFERSYASAPETDKDEITQPSSKKTKVRTPCSTIIDLEIR